ncbi:MAG: hypothetical protein RMI56_06550 [Sulfolobales archaeon]|nr:hypothetical protein [Sulfolobales archaeon]MDW8083434.1 hypothetical protein [Sulfolobales archaeon]
MPNDLRSAALKAVLLTSFLIVFSLSMWNWYDISIFENWFEASRSTSLYKIYEVPLALGNISYRVVYPPLPPLIYIGTRWLVDAAINAIIAIGRTAPTIGHALLTATDYFIRAIIKLPLLVFTVALATLLWKKLGSRASHWVIAGVPTLVTIANYQFDPLVAFSLYLSIIGLDIPRIGIILSSISTALIILTKPLAAISLLPLVYYIHRKMGKRDLVRYVVITLAVVLAFTLPFFLINPYAFIYNVFLFHSERAPQYISIWNLPVLLSKRNPEIARIVNSVWLPVMLAILGVAFLSLKKKLTLENRDNVVLATLILLLLVLIFNKVVNPNYLLWAYPLIIHLAYSREHKLKPRKTLITYNIAAALAALWGGLYMMIPALVNDIVVIEETGEIIPARNIIYRSLDTPLNETITNLISLSEKYYDYIKIVESYTNLLGASLIVTYSSVMLTLIWSLIRECSKPES